ncbi:MAG TPA: carboxypeptidase-like regulatory domain-containing protein [Gemmatimonadales bacterium]|nr:carboxypeptidase-like regulatory domain-containing protein [Gemmatimonadales bacterium]
MPRHAIRFVVALLFPAALSAQVDSSARLMGYAKSSFNGRPLSGVMISVPEARKFVVTDSAGTFLLGGLPVGKRTVLIAYNGRETEEYVFELRHGKTKRLAIILEVEALDLAPVVVEVRHRGDWNDLAGFYERRKVYGGWGRFFTQEDIQEQGFRSVADILRRMGIYTRCLDEGCVPTKWTYGAICPVTVAVDGMAFYPNEYESVAIDDVRGVEWYGNSRVGPRPLIPLISFPPDRIRDPRERELGGMPQRCFPQTVAIWTR